jgi:hypothetical protein
MKPVYPGTPRPCPGYKRGLHVLPLLRANFNHSVRRGYKKLCRPCNKAKRADERAAKAKA